MVISSTFLTTLGPSALGEYEYGYSGELKGISITLNTNLPIGTEYLIAFDFKAGNSNRGQIYGNGIELFDSYSTGSGSNRITAGWGSIKTVKANDTSFVSAIYLTGMGTLRIDSDFTLYYIRLQ